MGADGVFSLYRAGPCRLAALTNNHNITMIPFPLGSLSYQEQDTVLHFIVFVFFFHDSQERIFRGCSHSMLAIIPAPNTTLLLIYAINTSNWSDSPHAPSPCDHFISTSNQ